MQDIQGSTNTVIEQITSLLTTYGLSVVGAILILIVGWTFAGWAARATRRALERTEKVDEMLRGFFASLVRYFILTVAILAVLSEFGVQTASLIAVLGAAGLAIGLALQGTLSNLAAGVMLLLFRPFRVGQYVEAGGQAGTVKSVDLFVTELATPDNVQILIPNGQVWGSAVVNYSHHETRRVDFLLGIAYEDDIAKAAQTIETAIKGESRCLKDPEPMVVVGELADNSVNMIVRVWCNSADYWNVKFDLTRQFKEALDQAGITIPFPQRTIHMVSQTAA